MIHSMSVFHFVTLLISLMCLCYGLSFLSVICLISTAGAGYFLGMRVVDSDDHCRLIQRYVSSLLHLHLPRSTADPGSPGKASIQAQTSVQEAGQRHRRRHQDPPWEHLRLGRSLNDALEELLENVVQQYVCSWYRADISEDNAFVNEIRHQIRYAASVALQRLRKVDFSELILTDLVPPFAMHVERVARLVAEKESERTDLKIPLSTLEMNVLMQFTDLHFALMSRDNERDYLRMVADLLVERLIDQSRVTGRETTATEYNKPWPSHSCRHLLREIIVSTILVPAMDFVSDPDTLNKLILTALEPKTDASADDIDTKETTFLARLTERCQTDAPDSLLSVKLSDIVAKEGPLQRQFVLYLHDVGAPRHYLDCFVYARDIHNQMHWGKGSEDEILVDAWQFYSNYLYEGAKDRIVFEQKIAEDFAVAYKNRDMQALQKLIEEIYKKLYHALQYDYVIPFCQSESYLGYLCAAPPHVDELIRGPKDDEAVLNKAKTAQTATFSISQFKNRLFHVMGASEESIVEKEEPAVSATTREETLQRIHSAPVLGEVEPEVGDVALLHLGKDMSRWTISLPTIEPRKEPGTGRMYYVYCIHVCREDVPEDDPDELDLPKIWTLGRKYDEFYVLDEKLREFHGNALRLERLPEKKPFRAKSRAFMESQRTHFERYVRNLGAQPLLRRSDLLYVFLTSEEETLDSNFWPADLNIIRAVRRMPGKLARERGQNLKPFLLNILANSLAPTTVVGVRAYATDATTPTHKQKKLVNSISSSGVGSDE
ncbi:PXA domain-containing protein, partial [Aphelenchoides avenae]